MTTYDAAKTIQDFGEQWSHFTENRGYFASPQALIDIFGPLLVHEDIKGKLAADVGAGTGRFVRMLHTLGAKRILALEPSAAFEILKQHTSDLEGIDYLRDTADHLPERAFDFVFCIGVFQFIPDPAPALRAMGKALSPDGRLYLWVYGAENNGLYLSLIRPLRAITTRLPHKALLALCSMLLLAADSYAFVCRFLPFPLADYLRNYFSRLDRYSRRLVIYDQLNPRWVRYYNKEELEHLLQENGFTDISFYHRLGYSWSVSARYGGVN